MEKLSNLGIVSKLHSNLQSDFLVPDVRVLLGYSKTTSQFLSTTWLSQTIFEHQYKYFKNKLFNTCRTSYCLLFICVLYQNIHNIYIYHICDQWTKRRLSGPTPIQVLKDSRTAFPFIVSSSIIFIHFHLSLPCFPQCFAFLSFFFKTLPIEFKFGWKLKNGHYRRMESMINFHQFCCQIPDPKYHPSYEWNTYNTGRTQIVIQMVQISQHFHLTFGPY